MAQIGGSAGAIGATGGRRRADDPNKSPSGWRAFRRVYSGLAPAARSTAPIRWDSDGSGLQPDTSPAAIEALRAHLQALYPVAEVRLEVRAPLSFTGGLTWRGNVDFDALNSRLYDLRADEAIPDDTYLYALVRPMESYDVYCSNGCVTGQSWAVDDPADADLRNGSGVAFDPEQTAGTLAHELGHMFGRYHAPCGTSGDRDYPYDGAALGSWGWDARDGRFWGPEDATDFMAYCDPQWISDYTYAALFARVEALAALAGRRGFGPRRGALRWLHAPDDGPATLGAAVRAALRPGDVPVRFFGADGALLSSGTARRLPRGHGGRDYLVPLAPAGAARLSVDDPAGAVSLSAR